MKYRKKPVVIEAVQYAGNGNMNPRGAQPLWLFEAFERGTLVATNGNDPLKIKTLEGDLTVSPMDWIIQGVSGELYPCKPDIFEKTYDEVNDEVDNRGDVEQPEKKESFRARMARLTAKNANRGGLLYQQVIDGIDREARRGKYEMWCYTELSADLIKRLKEDGFVVGEQQWDRNEYLIKINW